MITDEDRAEVARLLGESHRFHTLYQQYKPRRANVPGQGAQINPGDDAAARQALKDASNARVQAAIIDPDHEADAWRDEQPQYDHRALMVFYVQQLAK